MEDDNSMSQRILHTLETILTNDPLLKDFIIIPCESNTKNKSPVLYEEHNIGLESWCVKHIYRYAYLELFETRKLLAKRKLSFSKQNNLNRLLIGVLLINPDVSTFWNMKRELVENDVIGAANELLFARLVLSYKSKSNEAFAYRRWLLGRTLAKLQANDLTTPRNLLENELAVCEMGAQKNANNYHAWSHRVWSLETLGARTANFNVIMDELTFSEKWVSGHVSEHTGFHYRQYLFNTVRKSRNITSVYEFYFCETVKLLGLVGENDPRDILTFLLGKEKSQGKPLEETINFVNFFCLLLYDLYNVVETLNSLYPNHESIWYHRRFLVYHLVKTAHEYHGLAFKTDVKLDEVILYGTNIVNVDGEKQPKLFKSQPNKVQSCRLYQTLVKNEAEFIRKNLVQSAQFHELELARRYEKWLKFVVCMEDV
ncbi:protein prenyltransferase alpha subunit repeat-containing protein 1-B [Tribolium castaneum]|uniref:Protein prenyltransferase alpha subunit repeat-containing protein 1-B-like Protein n=1 Tax=Tribolium castaneum TaxID=7070 RepID=D6X4Y9_TRICA|nr:PREDICTED: protein prenyltransferase alpha subunit repeat-containing protein 1-B [Tribolium castaneum]EEZ97598.1 Protein prenyltransferase alpha subunit repeat-containing protein 1-B-like Protein [Tribolium castaneum]|eukprot:XP_968950.1 PREDICTED: protein prenyltransferase alpha subunit repeat-containing protein 1-B [Tribolium castaneum]